MVCSLHSVTTGSRGRANVPLIIIIIISAVKLDMGFIRVPRCTMGFSPTLYC